MVGRRVRADQALDRAGDGWHAQHVGERRPGRVDLVERCPVRERRQPGVELGENALVELDGHDPIEAHDAGGDELAPSRPS